MIKKLSVLALAGCFALPTVASAASNADLATKIDQLSQELAQLRDQMEEQEEAFEEIDEKAEGWDLAARIQISGDIRSRMDYHSAETADHWTVGDIYAAGYMMTGAPAGSLTPTDWQNIMAMMAGYTPAQRVAMMNSMGLSADNSEDWENDTMYTTRLRMNMRVKATENIEVKARVVGYKAWGMQSNPAAPGLDTPYYQNSMTYDGTLARMPGNSALLLDRAFMNWNNIGGAPVWFSIGRRPTTDGPPAQLRMGAPKKMATPINYMDYPFDGVSLGYAYANLFGMQDMPGRVRVCYGRGFEAGVQNEDNSGINDTDFGGLSWDVLKKGTRFINIQSFGAFNIFNFPGDFDMSNPIMGEMTGTTDLERQNMGDIYHTSAVYMDAIGSFNYFAALGWSYTVPSGTDAWGQSLLGSDDNESGYNIYVGGRYDMDDLGLKFGFEYNYGSENWLAFTPGHDDLYASKLQVRGHVFELYTIYDLPSGEAVSKFGNAFLRLGYQHYEYEHSGSGNWMMAPIEMGDLADDPLNMQPVAPIESYDSIYLTFEAYF